LNRGSRVCGFVDFSKTFDKVNYWKLIYQMIDDGSACVSCEVNDIYIVFQVL